MNSLGIAVPRRNEFNDIKEISSLADNLKIITIMIPEIRYTIALIMIFYIEM